MNQPNDVQFATTHLSRGVTLHYAERGDPTGEAIIFLHGYSDSWFSFSRVLPLLSPSYHAFALTQRGHGDSDKPRCCYTPDDFAADVDAFMDVVGLEEATLVGASTGALFAQRVALSYPHRVSRLVLVGPQTPANEAVSGLREEVQALEDPVPPEFVREFQESTIYHPVPEEFLDTVVSESLKLPARVWRDYMEQAVLSIDHDYVLSLREIDVPTLILWGEQDPLFPREEQERLAATIPDATLKVYPETGHAVHWDQPEQVVRDLEAFMKERHACRQIVLRLPKQEGVESMETRAHPPGLQDVLEFPLVEALYGRRARRFSLGTSIPDGPLAFTSEHDPLPLSELEQMIVLTAAAGNTGWHYMIMRHARYAPHLSNYSGAAGGRTFPSAAGFHTSEVFFTDDEGVYLFETRDAPALVEQTADGPPDLETILQAHRGRIRKVSDSRLYIPAEEPYMEGHNTWCANRPGSTLLIPVGDIAQHMIAVLCFLLQNGYVIYDDVNGERITGLERFSHFANVDEPLPLTFMETYAITECTAELSTCCYAGMLMLQAMGLGGWMFDGIDRYTVLGASGDPQVPGLGFRYDTDDRWPLPNPTGLPGVFEGYCPPHYSDMRAAVEAFAERKFGPGGPFHPDTPGPWKESSRVRSSAQVHSEEFKECVALQAQYIYDRFGKFPGTVPSIFVLTYLQAHHLDLEFYDQYFGAGAYLQTHANHMARWHGEGGDE